MYEKIHLYIYQYIIIFILHLITNLNFKIYLIFIINQNYYFKSIHLLYIQLFIKVYLKDFLNFLILHLFIYLKIIFHFKNNFQDQVYFNPFNLKLILKILFFNLNLINIIFILKFKCLIFQFFNFIFSFMNHVFIIIYFIFLHQNFFIGLKDMYSYFTLILLNFLLFKFRYL